MFIQHQISNIQNPLFQLASLREYASRKFPVVSLYLDVNGARYPRKGDYQTEYNFLVHEARKTAAGTLSLSKDQEDWLELELQTIGEFLALEFKREGTRGLVIFSCRDEGLWQVIPLKVSVANRLLVDWKPRLANLAETMSRYQHYCVLLTNKETARIFDEFAGELVEHSEIFDAVLKRHAQGGWEQTKLQRRHELQVHHHLKKASDATLDYFRSHSFNRLVVGINEELWPEMEKVLHPYLKQRLAGRFNVDMNATTNEIQEKVAAIEDELRRQEESSLLKSLGPELKAGKSFAGGLDDVLAALNERRVEVLFVESGYSEIGRLCNSCHTVAFKEEVCPTCRIDMRLIPNVVDEARELAVRQDARIITVASGHPAMKQAGGVAVRLRY